MALNPAQIGIDQNWINQQWGGGYGANGQFQPGSVNFTGGYDVNANPNRNWGILGAADATGQSDADVSQVFGGQYTPEQIAAYRQQYAPQIDMARQSYLATNGGSYDPNNAPGSGGSVTTTPGPAGGAGAGGVSWAGGGYGDYTRSPYLDDIASDITTQSNNNLLRNVLPSIRSGDAVMGGTGGSRDALTQGLAIGDSQRSLQGALANLDQNDFEASMQRGITRYGMDQGYDLGQGQLALGNRTLDTNAFLQNKGLDNTWNIASRGLDINNANQNRALDQSGARTGADLEQMGLQNEWYPYLMASNIFGGASSLGGSTTGTTSQGGGATGAAGGAMGTYQMGKNLGWWG